MSATSDSDLFELLENNDAKDIIDVVIEKSLLIKKAVVEEDEKETGLRKVLNFGHTVGHAIESVTGLGTLYHGECVALGMMFMSTGKAKEQIKNLLSKYNLPINNYYKKLSNICPTSAKKRFFVQHLSDNILYALNLILLYFVMYQSCEVKIR